MSGPSGEANWATLSTGPAWAWDREGARPVDRRKASQNPLRESKPLSSAVSVTPDPLRRREKAWPIRRDLR